MRRLLARCLRPSLRLLPGVVLLVLVPAVALSQANGKLQLHHIKVGQGDGILLISPLGQTALFDDGVYTNCTEIKNYIQGLGISVVNYHFASHYHADHIGCIDDLAAIGITIGTAGYDRGSSYSSATYTNYVNTLGGKRQTIAKNQVITLDAGATYPVYLECVDLNGAGVYSPSGSDENAKSVVMKVSYGSFDEVIGGDLTGSTSQSNDVETTVGPEVGDVEVYKVHHHGSLYSSNDNWLDATTPEVGIIQVGNGNSYGHPTAAALGRMHAHGVKTYWTETGAGATPDPIWDKVASGAIVVQADPGATASYTVNGPGFSDTYTNGGSSPPINTTEVAEAITLLKGSITVGDYTRLAANDAVRVSISAGVEGGSYVTDWYGVVTLDHPPLNLTITYDGNYTVTRTQYLSLWDWTTGAWVQIDNTSVGTTDKTRTWSTSSPASYVSATREVRLRVRGSLRSAGSYTCRGDYMAFTYDYASGTVVAPVAELESRHPAHALGEPESRVLPHSEVLRLEALPVAAGVSLAWAIDPSAHVDGFSVYRENGAGEREFLGHEATLEVATNEIRFGFIDASPGAGSGAYWLGSRSCSGSEGMIGPLRAVGAARPTAAITLAAAPNPSRSTVRFDFTLERTALVRLDLFDLAGRRVATPFTGLAEAGTTSVTWGRTGDDGAALSAGVYFARLEGAGRSVVVRVLTLER